MPRQRCAVAFHYSSTASLLGNLLSLVLGLVDLLILGGGVSLRSEVSGGAARLRKESGEDWLNDGSENDLSAVGHGQRHPKDKDEFEDIVECYHMLAPGLRGRAE